MRVVYRVIFLINETVLSFLDCTLHYQLSHARSVYLTHPQRMRLQKLWLLYPHSHSRSVLFLILAKGQRIRGDRKVPHILQRVLIFFLLTERTLLLSADNFDTPSLLFQSIAISSLSGRVFSFLALHDREDLGLPRIRSFCYLLRQSPIRLQTIFMMAVLVRQGHTPTDRQAPLQK